MGLGKPQLMEQFCRIYDEHSFGILKKYFLLAEKQEARE